MNLVLIADDELLAGNTVELTGARAAHLLDVLRVEPGDTVRVGRIDGPLGTGRVVAAGQRRVELQLTLSTTAPERPPVDLLLALPRPKVMQRLWAQLAALGVGRITLTNAERVERHYFDTHVLDPATYQPLLVEGLQQARDTRVPIVSIHRRFRVLIEDELDAMTGEAQRLVADPGVTTRVGDIVRTSEVPRVVIAVGPEGGWNDFERQLLAAHGFHAVGMGTRTLRTDTACIALLALIHETMRGRRPV